MRARVAFASVATTAGLLLISRFKTPSQTTALPRPAASAPAQSGGAVDVPTPPADGATGAGGRYRDGTFTGRDVSMRYGDVQVKIVVAHHQIAEVDALQLPYDRPRSAYISRVAGPMLREEVLQAQSAQIDTVSGATYTSDAYARSVQSALDEAR